MNKVLEEISKIGILPVVVLEDAKDAKPLAQALCAGGLPCAEVTFRTAAAKESIAIMRKEFPEMLVGAGTVLTVEQVDEALEAGAQFIISPGFDEDVVQHCIEKNVPVTPGTCTPSDVQKCYRIRFGCSKILPCRSSRWIKDDQVHCRSIYTNEIHSYWWNQCEQHERLLRIQPYLSYWW